MAWNIPLISWGQLSCLSLHKFLSHPHPTQCKYGITQAQQEGVICALLATNPNNSVLQVQIGKVIYLYYLFLKLMIKVTCSF